MPRLKPIASSTLRLIGWRERVRLPELALGTLIAKVDTGARSAALHAEEIVIHGNRVRFVVPVNGKNHHHDLPLAGHRRVKNSSGRTESRAVIETAIAIGDEQWQAEVTLTNRRDMGVPMLMGRATIRGRYAVHPGKAFILSRSKPAKKKKS
jgi:hypothetical protein